MSDNSHHIGHSHHSGSRIRGTDGNDILIGTPEDDRIDGGKGDDIINAGEGDNRIKGGKGDDVITSGAGDDRIDGGKGDDTIDAGDGDNRIKGGKGDDVITSGAGDDHIDGGKGDDIIDAGDGDNHVKGGKGDDQITVGAGDDKVDGGKGDDTIIDNGGNDRIKGGSGDDTVVYNAAANTGTHDVYDGGSGDDTLLLELTRDDWFRPEVQADIAQFLEWLDRHDNRDGRGHSGDDEHGGGHGHDDDHGRDDHHGDDQFHFTAFDLTVRKFEALRVTVDGVELDPTDELVDAVDDVVETDEDTSLSGNVLGNDDVPDLVREVRLINDVAAGNLTLNADGSFDYDPGTAFDYLAVDETALVSFTYEVEDADGDTDQAVVTITITGANDAPVIGVADNTAGITEIADNAAGENTDTHLAGGSIAFVDVDLSDTHTITATAQDAGYLGTFAASLTDPSTGDGAGSIGWTFNVPDADLDFLAAGQILTQHYEVAVDDGHGGIDTEIVELTLTGTNDVPVVTAIAVSTNEDASGNVQSILFVDDDGGLNGQGTWLTHLGNLGYSIDYEALSFYGNPASNLNDYDLVLWSIGDQAYTNLTTANVSTLSSYLDGGGNLLYAGGHSLYEETQAHSFIQGYLGLTNYQYNMPYTGSTATGPGGSYSLEYWSGGNWGNMMSAFDASAATETLMTLDSWGGAADIAAINATETFTAATWGFDINHLAASQREGFLADTLNEFGTSVVEVDLLGTASDVDINDVLSINSVIQTTGTTAAYTLAGSTFTLVPAGQFDHLAVGETEDVTFTYNVNDGHVDVQNTLTITVAGRNDGPVAVDDVVTGGSSYGDIAVFGASDGTGGAGFVADDLLALGIFDSVSVLNGSENLAMLNQYDAVLAYQNGYSSSTYMGNLLADYVDGGGGVVAATFIWQNEANYYGGDWGRLESDGYLPFENYQGNYSYVSLGSYDASHAIMDSAFTITSVGGYYHDVVDLTSDAQLVASWNTGSPFVAVDGSGVVGISLFPNDYYGQLSGQYMELFGNALGYVANTGPDEDTAIDIDVLANDTDVDTTDVLSVSAFDVLSANGAVVSLNLDGTLHYDPTSAAALQALAVGESLVDTFDYTVSDGHGGFDTATVSVEVNGVNDAPSLDDVHLYTNVQAGDTFVLPQSAIAALTADIDTSDVHVVTGLSNVSGAVTASLAGVGDINVTMQSTATGGPISLGNSLVNGLGGSAGFGEGVLGANDDGSTSFINLSSVFEDGLDFFGTNYAGFYVNNNGNVTFNTSQYTYTPFVLTGSTGNPIIAPFFADVDTRGSHANTPTPGGNSTGTNLVYYDMDTVNDIVTVTWNDVGYYNSHSSPLNAFQMQLYDRSNGDFDIVFRYEDINWTTGDASGGYGGLGGTVARAGWSSGNGTDYAELSGSGNQSSMLDLENANGNLAVPGVWAWQVRDGSVSQAPIGQFDVTVSDGNGGSDTGTVQVHQGNTTTIVAGAGDDVVIGDVSNDSLTGGAGDDLFVFTDGGGNDTVVDFQAGAGSDDILDISDFGFADLAAVQTVTTDTGADMVIQLDVDDSVTLLGVSDPSLLHTDDFTFA